MHDKRHFQILIPLHHSRRTNNEKHVRVFSTKNAEISKKIEYFLRHDSRKFFLPDKIHLHNEENLTLGHQNLIENVHVQDLHHEPKTTERYHLLLLLLFHVCPPKKRPQNRKFPY